MLKSYLRDLGADGLNLIDIGSSGSLDAKWDPLKKIINLVGFDPNKNECDRQNTLPSPYKSSVFLPYAVHGKAGIEILYKTRSIYCYSLLKPNKQWLDRFSFHDLFDVVDEEPISVKPIDEIDELRDFFPDVIKIDVQGLELPILRRAGHLLDRAFYVETETGFIENYLGETIFSQLDEFMRANGFLMFDLNIDHRIPRNNAFKHHPTGGEQILWAEAVWLKDYIGMEKAGKFDSKNLTKQQVKKVLLLCGLQGCYDYGFELAEYFHDKDLLSKAELDSLGKADAWDLIEVAEPVEKVIALGSRTEMLRKLFGILPDRLRRAIHAASS